MIFSIFLIVLPLLVIVFFNWSVYKTAKTHINSFKIQIESVSGLEDSQQRQQQEMIQRNSHHRRLFHGQRVLQPTHLFLSEERFSS